MKLHRFLPSDFDTVLRWVVVVVLIVTVGMLAYDMYSEVGA